MADEPISLLPAASEIDNADLLVLVQAGTTKKGTKALLLTSGPAENLKLVANNGTSIEFLATGDLSITLGAGKKLTIVANGAGIVTTSAGQLSLGSATGLPTQVSIKVGNPANWIGPPIDMQTAIDRLAQRIVIPGAGPIA